MLFKPYSHVIPAIRTLSSLYYNYPNLSPRPRPVSFFLIPPLLFYPSSSFSLLLFFFSFFFFFVSLLSLSLSLSLFPPPFLPTEPISSSFTEQGSLPALHARLQPKLPASSTNASLPTSPTLSPHYSNHPRWLSGVPKTTTKAPRIKLGEKQGTSPFRSKDLIAYKSKTHQIKALDSPLEDLPPQVWPPKSGRMAASRRPKNRSKTSPKQGSRPLPQRSLPSSSYTPPNLSHRTSSHGSSSSPSPTTGEWLDGCQQAAEMGHSALLPSRLKSQSSLSDLRVKT